MSDINLFIEGTQNPNIVKFVANKAIIKNGSFQFNSAVEAENAPLAQQLFQLPFVAKVYMTSNFIAIEKYEMVEWNDVKDELKELMEVYLNSGLDVVKDGAKEYVKPVEIYLESTPNPDVIKFGTNRILAKEDFEYREASQALNSPLAQSLFNFPFIKEVFIAENYVSITKQGALDWNDVVYELRDFLKNYLQSGKLIIDDSIEVVKEVVQTIDSSTLEGTAHDIAKILEDQIRPAVAQDGGNISFQDYDEDSKVVKVLLQGACSGCPSSTMTLKNGIEATLKNMLPGKVEEVVAINA